MESGEMDASGLSTPEGLNQRPIMSTFTQIYYHLVFSTKARERVLVENHREEFFRYTWGIIRNKDSHLYRINAVDDHVILSSLHPVSLADFIKGIKVATSVWIKEKGLFPGFQGWQDGYGGFTASHADKDRLIKYIRNQQEHHRVKTFREELHERLLEAEVKFDEKYLD
jgi:REP element-mobilizing transposase RayT